MDQREWFRRRVAIDGIAEPMVHRPGASEPAQAIELLAQSQMADWGIEEFRSYIDEAHRTGHLATVLDDALTYLFARIDRLNAEIKDLREREAEWVAYDYEGRPS